MVRNAAKNLLSAKVPKYLRDGAEQSRLPDPQILIQRLNPFPILLGATLAISVPPVIDHCAILPRALLLAVAWQVA